MECITVKVSSIPDCNEIFIIISDDFHQQTSALNIGRMIEETGSQISTSLSTRIPRVYVKSGKIVKIEKFLN